MEVKDLKSKSTSLSKYINPSKDQIDKDNYKQRHSNSMCLP